MKITGFTGMKFSLAALIAASGVTAGLSALGHHPKTATRRNRKPFPTMVVSAPDVIERHNANCQTRQVLRAKARAAHRAGR